MQTEENKNLEYSHPARERFREEGKLFLVDYSKACAAEVILSILEDASVSSFLMVAENAASAADYAERLGSVLGKITVITSYDDFTKAVGFNPTDYARAADAEIVHGCFRVCCLEQRYVAVVLDAGACALGNAVTKEANGLSVQIHFLYLLKGKSFSFIVLGAATLVNLFLKK